MTLSLNLIDSLYSTKNGAVAYNGLDNLVTSGKYDLLRINRISPNGLSITVCSISTINKALNVSKKNAEAGISPIEIKQGQPFIFEGNYRSEEVDYKTKAKTDLKDKRFIDAFSDLVKKFELQEGVIYWAKMEMNALSVDDKDLIDLIHKKYFDFAEAGLAKPDFYEKAGINFNLWMPALELIDSTKFVAPKEYTPKATKDEVFLSNLEAVKRITDDQVADAYQAVHGFDGRDQEGHSFRDFASEIKMAILLSI